MYVSLYGNLVNTISYVKNIVLRLMILKLVVFAKTVKYNSLPPNYTNPELLLTNVFFLRFLCMFFCLFMSGFANFQQQRFHANFLILPAFLQ